MSITSYVRTAADILRHQSNQGHWGSVLKRTLALRLAILEKRAIDFDFLNGTRIRVWPDTHACRELAYYRIPDYPQMEFMLAYLRPGDNVIDVGANVGLYTVLAASLIKPTGSVDAVEAVPNTARRLLENIALNLMNHRVSVHQVAVGSSTEWAEMTVTHEASNHIVLDGATGEGFVRVKTGRLDDIAQRTTYAFGKIDIEGREWDAFRGAQRLLTARTPPIWVAEINGSLFRYGHQVAPFLEWMADLGFQPWMYEPRSRTLRRMHEDVWGDVFFVAGDRLGVIKERIPGLRLVD